uniref:Chromo domain-containing protein n=1 Tax=Parastrongyloides trichosuri TaxID=131310 RepID=A0A0N4Z9X2_PARTI
MSAWDIKSIVEKIPVTEKGKKTYLFKVRWADSLVTENDFRDKSIVRSFLNGDFQYKVIGPERKTNDKSVIPITKMYWIIESEKTGEQKRVSYKTVKDEYPDQLIKFYEKNAAPYI